MPLSSFLEERRAVFSTLGVYGRFEQIVFYVLTLVISVVIVVAVGHLSVRVLALALLNEIDPLNQEVFQSVFGMIMTVLIALEFNHSILAVLERHDNIVQVRTVILIALLALVRKFIILDATKVGAMTLVGLALAVISLGTVYWLVRDQDEKEVVRRRSLAATDAARR